MDQTFAPMLHFNFGGRSNKLELHVNVFEGHVIISIVIVIIVVFKQIKICPSSGSYAIVDRV